MFAKKPKLSIQAKRLLTVIVTVPILFVYTGETYQRVFNHKQPKKLETKDKAPPIPDWQAQEDEEMERIARSIAQAHPGPPKE